MKLLMGNHEKLMMDALTTGKHHYDWVRRNGGDKTLEEYEQLPEEEQQELLAYLEALPYYFEVSVNGQKFLLIHAGLELNDEMREMDIETILSSQNPMTMVWLREEFYYRKGIPGYIIVYGHTPIVGSEQARYDRTFNDKVCIDTGCAYGGGLLALRLDDMKEFYIPKGEELHEN